VGIRACHHFAICVRDAEEARAFWGNALGLEELERPAAVQKFPGVWYSLGVSELHVIQNPEATPPQGPLAPHIALASEDFEQTIARVSAAGFSFAFGPERGPDGVLRAITRDPTGNTVEITDAALRATEV
jgi:catechol 2,3-dioxygenase-like lactoylglutathione lyase family enzyme